MTNKELVKSIYPNVICAKTNRGSRYVPIKYYFRNADSHIANALFNSPQEAWSVAGKHIKKAMLEKLSR